MGFHGFTCGGSSRVRFAFVIAMVVALVATGSAAAGIVRALRPVERRAVAVSSLSATADPAGGLIVTATFRGDVERYLGQGRLAQGLVALVLVPKAIGAPASGVLDAGGGFVPTSLRGHRTIDVFGLEHVAPVRSAHTLVARAGNEVIFHLPSVRSDRLRKVALDAFATSPVPIGRLSHPGAWHVVLTSRPTTSASARPPAPSCSGLAARARDLAATISGRLQPELHAQEEARGQLPARSRELAGIGHLRGEVSALRKLVRSLDAKARACTAGPPPPPPAETTTATATVSPPPAPSLSVQVVQTDPALAQSMAPQPGLAMSSIQPPGVPIIPVDEQTRYQQFSGIGAAMTDSSAYLIGTKMSSAQRAELLQELFGAAGSGGGLAAPPIHLNFLRVGVAATGAMTVDPAYSYDDGPADPTLANFSTQHDDAYLIPTLQQALTVNPQLQVLATPWSSPGWMKSNGALDNTNNNGTLLTGDYGVYASYLVRFIQDYQSHGIPISAITPANEPTASSPYPGLNLPESGEAQFIAQDLAPALSQAGLQTKIYGTDLSWDRLQNYASPLVADANAGPDLAGTAWHCYFGSPTVMSQLHQQAPSKDQIVDECSPEIRPFGTPEFLISALRNWASAVAIWSVALEANGDPIQKPNHCGGCLGAVSIDPQTGDATPRTEYYQLGQVSAFVQPGATRIDSPNFVTYATNGSNMETISPNLDDVAFLNPDGSKVLVAYNNGSQPIAFAVDSDGRYFTYTIPAGAMTTFVWH